MGKETQTMAEEAMRALMMYLDEQWNFSAKDLKSALAFGPGIDGSRRETFKKYVDFCEKRGLIESTGFGTWKMTMEGMHAGEKAKARLFRQAHITTRTKAIELYGAVLEAKQ